MSSQLNIDFSSFQVLSVGEHQCSERVDVKGGQHKSYHEVSSCHKPHHWLNVRHFLPVELESRREEEYKWADEKTEEQRFKRVENESTPISLHRLTL